MPETTTFFSRSARLFALAWELVFVALLAVGLVRFLTVAHPAWAGVAVVVIVVALVAWRAVALATAGRGVAPAMSLAITIVLAAVLIVVSADFVWIAFPIFLWCFQVWRPRVAVPVVVAIAALAVASGVGHSERFDAGHVLGPTIGAVVAAVMALGYKSLAHESEQRRRLIEDLERTRETLRVSEREAATLAERQRLAREVHDTITQGLSSIAMLLQAAGSQVSSDPDKCRDHIDLARRTALEDLGEARRFVRALTSPALDDVALDEALSESCRRIGEETGIDAHFEVEGEPRPLGTDQQLALYRVAQSALGNVRQHAGARRVDVTITFLEDGVNLDVVDDGIGFDPAARPATGSGSGSEGGFGLSVMAQRLRDLGGSLAIESAPGAGTAVAASLPSGPSPTATTGGGA